MKRKVLAIALSLALLTSLFVFAAPVSAEPRQDCSFVFGPSTESTVVLDYGYRGDSGNMHWLFIIPYDITGDLVSTETFWLDFSSMQHRGNIGKENAQLANGRTSGIFTGTFMGSDVGTAIIRCNFMGPTTGYAGPGTLEGLSGGLVGLHINFNILVGDCEGTYQWDSGDK